MEKGFNYFTASDGTEIRYVDMGEGKPFLFVHGFGGSTDYQIPFFKLIEKDFRCICFDQRGYGKTEGRGDIGLARSAQDAKELLEYLGLEDVVFLGYSMGAGVMFSYIRQFGSLHLERIIIGEMSPKLINDDDWHYGLYQGWYTQDRYEKDIWNMVNGHYSDFNTFFVVQTCFKHTPEEVRDFDSSTIDIDAVLEQAGPARPTFEAMLSVSEDQKYSNMLYWRSMGEADNRDVLEKIDVPTAIFYANPGSIYDPRAAHYMSERIPNNKMYRYEDCTHMAKNERLDQFVHDIYEFCEI